MPSFFIKDGRHCVSIITGPRHVLLGIRFADHPVEPVMVRLPASGPCDHGPLDEARIRQQVLEGLALARREHGVEMYAAEIAYVENDTPTYELYLVEPQLLVRRIVSGGEFRQLD